MSDPTSRLVRRYYLYQATANCAFFSPVFFLFYQDRAGLTVATVLWLQSWALFVRGALDLPFGALADRVSRRVCLEASAVGYVLGAATLLVRPTLAGAVVAETLFAGAGAMRSGADSLFLFDALAAGGHLDRYPRAESRGQAIVSLASGATAITGGLLAARDLALPYVATIVVATGSAIVARTLADDAPAPRPARPRGLMREAAADAAASPVLRWTVALAAFAIVTSHVYFYLQQPYLRAIGVPVALFGVVMASTKVVTALVASVAYRVDGRVGPVGTATIMAAVPAIGLGAMSVAASPAAAVLVLSRGILDGLWQPLTNVYVNRLVGSRLRATMLSLQSLVARLALGVALALLGVGVSGDGIGGGIAHALRAAAIGALVVVGLLAVSGGRVVGARVAAPETCDSNRA